MANKIEIKIGNKKIIAEVNDWSDELPAELCVYLADENDRIVQDICCVRERYHFDKNTGRFKINSNFIDCLVWGDSDDDDYSNEFCIGVREYEE